MKLRTGLFLLILLGLSAELYAYIDPNVGLPVLTSGTPLLTYLLMGLAFLLVPFRFLKNSFRDPKRIFIFGLLILLVISVSVIIYLKTMTADRKIIVLGIDALDQAILEKYSDELPNIKKIKAENYYSSLKIPNPPESPLIWRTIITGLMPGDHGLFDFIYRIPGDYLPRLTFLKALRQEKGLFKKKLKNSDIWGETLWDKLGAEGISSTVLWAPTTFPPDKIKGKLLSGMGTPDIRGNLGRYSFISKEGAMENRRDFSAEDWTYTFTIEGPDYKDKNGPKTSLCRAELKKLDNSSSELVFEGSDPVAIKLKEWSGHIKLRFDLKGRKVRGLCRVYMESNPPDLKLYVSPVYINPENPLYDISYPVSYAKKLVKEHGYFNTLGMPNDTNALADNALSEEAFIESLKLNFSERLNIYYEELEKLKSGLLFYYTDLVDSTQHMFWKEFKSGDEKAVKLILDTYKDIDELIGKTLKHMSPGDILIIASDHGFASYEHSFNINSWLRDNGYITLKGSKTTSGDLFEDVDWSKTKAYSLGFGNIYLNIRGRESDGIVAPAAENKLIEEISGKLENFIDPETGERTVNKVYSKYELFNGKHIDQAPEMYCAFKKGYRTSADSAIGGVKASIIEPNLKKWSGDHIFDAELIPGVIMIVDPSSEDYPSKAEDVTPYILGKYN